MQSMKQEFLWMIGEINMLDLHDLYTMEYAKENDENYGRCETCKHYGNCNYCSDCDEGSEYKFDLIYYQREHDEEIAKWIEENR
jgi:hypothetical protein